MDGCQAGLGVLRFQPLGALELFCFEGMRAWLNPVLDVRHVSTHVPRMHQARATHASAWHMPGTYLMHALCMRGTCLMHAWHMPYACVAHEDPGMRGTCMCQACAMHALFLGW